MMQDDGVPDLIGSERILLVDDEPEIAESCSRMLRGYGYQVTARTSSYEALELFKTKPTAFDILITDYTMPQLTGLQLAREMKHLDPNLAIILISGYSAAIGTRLLADAGVGAVVLKPIVGRSSLKKYGLFLQRALLIQNGLVWYILCN
ncbi:MAG: response regulator [bacterium]|nr:response regulator [bacterium]